MVSFRKARAKDADTLSQIAFSAKAHWGYPKEWLSLWVDDLTVTAEKIAAHHFIVATDREIVLGFIGVSLTDGAGEVEHLWVQPRYMGQGVGRSLFRATAQWCAVQGISLLRIASDPNAVGFYEAMGCKVVGSQPSRPVPRMLPVSHYQVFAS